MSLPRYQTYKSSGIEWLGEVPAHWEVKRADSVLSYEKEQARMERFRDSEVFYYSIPLIQETGDGALVRGEAIESDKILLKGHELLVSKLNPRKGMVLISRPHDAPTVCSTEFVPMRAIGCDLDFAYWLYVCEPVRRLISSTVQSVTRSHQRANPADITKQSLVFPPLGEQALISRFLRNATEHIDALIAEQKRLIDLLKEKRQAVISHAVTKGVNPDTPMKPSGVEWIGDVPAHWNIDRLKRSVARCKNGIWGDEPNGDSDDITCVRVADFDRAKLRVALREPTRRRVTTAERAGRELNAGNLLLEKSGGGENQPVGAVVLYDAQESSVCSNFVARMELASEMSSSYWRYVHAAAYRVGVNTRSIKQTSGIQNLDQQQYLDERAPFPPYEEQVAIAEAIEAELDSLDTVIEESSHAIALLQERRSALISAAVTGKIDVRHFADVEAA